MRINAAVDAIDGFLKKGKTENDSIVTYWEAFTMGCRYNYHKGSYESLMSVGLDKISNDSIRAELTSLYGFQLHRTYELIEYNNSKVR